ncbi:MAG: hypothetical protein ACI93P_000161 [bacterium]|jgi:hypothetical protein
MILLLIVIFVLIFVKQLRIISKYKTYFYIFISSFFVKLLLLILSENNIIVLVEGGADTINFVLESLKIYNNKDFFGFLTYSNPEGTFPYLLSMVYALTYPSHLVILFIGILLHNSIIIKISKILDFFYLNKRNKFFLVLLISFFPLMLSYSVILLREIFYIWYITIVCCNIVQFNYRKKIESSYIFLCLTSIILIFLHIGNLAIVFGTFILFFKLNRFVKYSLISLLIFGFSYLVVNKMATSYVNKYSLTETDLFVSKINASREFSPAYYKKYYSSSMLNNVFFALPVDYINFYFKPFIYPISNVYRRLFRYPYGLLSLYSFLIVLRNYRNVGSNEKKMLLLLLIGMFPYVIGSGDLFQAVRHRMNFFPQIIILIAMFNQNHKSEYKYGK